MARLARLFAPGVPQLAQARFAVPLNAAQAQHVILEQASQWLQESARAQQLALHAWLVTNEQVVILGTGTSATAMSRVIQDLGRKLAARLRLGKVFAERFRSTIVEPGQWVIPCQLWLEGLVVRQELAAEPEFWAWSSASHHLGLSVCQEMTAHADYWACGNTPFERQAAYRGLSREGLGRSQIQQIEAALQGQWALGSAGFLETVGESATRRPVMARRGRPKRCKI
ncbi:MAG: hypothetical protein M0Q54_10365 [Pigmentiphaga sp.]|nr:hypothetical protein [Pigmentiphaga sp.]